MKSLHTIAHNVGAGRRPATLPVALITLFLAFTVAAAERPPVGWMVYPYQVGSRLSDEDFQRLITNPAIEYVGIQVYLNRAPDELTCRRVGELAAAGKRVIAQIWWGSGGRWSWERYNMPNLALDPAIGNDFFSNGVDALMAALGPENIYAAHLLEESGMQFGWDADIPGDPDDLTDGLSNSNNYDNPANWPWNRGISGPEILSIRRWREVCRTETGLDVAWYPVWTHEQMRTYRNWVAARLEAGAHIAFKDHALRAYPALHVYAWNGRASMVRESERLDGFFADPYTSITGVYMSYRNIRQVFGPEQEVIGMVWGNREESLTSRPRGPSQAACYAAGCNVLSAFGDDEATDPEWMVRGQAAVQPFIGLPLMTASSPLLLLSCGTLTGATLSNAQFWVTGLAWYDMADPDTMPKTDLAKYRMIVSWGLEHPDTAAWVRAGGILVAVQPREDFLARDGVLGVAPRGDRRSGPYEPDPWMREHLGLRDRYDLELMFAAQREVLTPEGVHVDDFIHVVRCGKGLVVTTPAIAWVHAPWKYEAHWEEYRKLLLDLARGAARLGGRPELADQCFDDPANGHDYLRVPDPEKRRAIYILHTDQHGEAGSATDFVVPGYDRVSGKRDVRLNQQNPVVVIEEGK